MHQILKIALTLCVGAAGGAAFWLASMPLPWMLGSMCAVAVTAVGKGPVASVRRIRPPLAAVIGVTLGSSFRPEIVSNLGHWVPVTIALLVSTVLIGTLGSYYLRRVAGFDAVTAYFSAMPSGVYEMTYQGGLLGGDERRIALIHAVRIFMIVLTVPIAFRLIFDLGAPGPRPVGGAAEGFALADMAILTLCGLVGWPLARRIGMPNPPMLGPMLASAAVHALGLTETAPPIVLVSVAQVFLGSSIGGQFIGARLRDLRTTALHGVVLIPLMLGIGGAIAVVASRFSYLDLPTIFLALSPGGTAEMSLIAVALQTEVAAVVTHQILRVLLIQSVAVWVFRRIGRAGG